MKSFALDRVLSVAGTYAAANAAKGIAAGDCAFFADQIADPSLSVTAETEDIVDALNNVVMVLENGRGATFGASSAFFNGAIFAQQVGGKVETKDATFTKYDILTAVTDNSSVKVTLSRTPSADLVFTGEGANAKIYKLTTAKAFTTETVTTGTYATGAVTFASGVAAGDHVLVVYSATIEDADVIAANANAKNELLDVTAECLLRDLCDESLYYAYIVMRGKLSGETEWSMTRDGQHAFEIRCMPEYCSADRKLFEVILAE